MSVAKPPLSSPLVLSSNTATFGLSKDLTVPAILKLCYLKPLSTSIARIISSLALSLEKYQDSALFKRLSHIYFNSDLFVTVDIFDGNHNRISTTVQAPYVPFSNNRRTWNKCIRLPVHFSQLAVDSYLKITIFEIVDTRPVVFGVGTLSFFNTGTSSLRKGSYKIKISTGTGSASPDVEYGEIHGSTHLEKKLVDYENGDFPRSSWLDKLFLSHLELERSLKLKHRLTYGGFNEERPRKSDHVDAGSDDEDDDPGSPDIVYYLYVELPNFELPIVYSDITYSLPQTSFSTLSQPPAMADATNSNVIINSLDIPMSKKAPHTLLKVYDPDFQNLSLKNLTLDRIPGEDKRTNNNDLDPIEMKYHELERNIDNNSMLDKELKPSPQLRDELLRILQKPSNVELSDVEKRLIWRFRYFFSKNNSTTVITDAGGHSSNPSTATKSTKLFLTKFLKSINWENDYELDHTFTEIIPHYWTVDKIEIGDALELLSNYFNPYTLGSGMRHRPSSQGENPLGNKDELSSDEARFRRIFKHVVFLRKLAVDRLRLASGEELLLYLLQLVQALKYESAIFEKYHFKKLQTSPRSAGAEEENDTLLSSPLAKFLIEKSIENNHLGNFFYWYVKVENEDQINQGSGKPIKIYSLVLNAYIENLKKHSAINKLPNYNHLKRQIWLIKKLTNLVSLSRNSFKKGEATAKKVQFLRDYLLDSSNELLKFPEPFPLPLDPSVIICGCYPNESSVFKSSLAPLKITFKTILNPESSHSSQIFGKKNYKYGKYALMFKIGDDLRQDQLVIQIINLMDQLLKNENLDLRLTPYKILATSPVAGLIQFVPNETLDEVLAQTYPVSVIGENSNGADTEISISNNGILSFLKLHSRDSQTAEPEATSVLGNSSSLYNGQQQHTITSDLGVSAVVMDNYVKSCAGYCVITYLLGVGDRHLDNLLLSPNGKFWHADFGYILGRDPKPFPPLMKLPIQVIDGMGGLGHENFNVFKSYCFITYTALRKNSNLILNLFQLMLDANIPDIQIDPKRAVEKVQEKFYLEFSEEEAILHFQNLINDSVNALLPVVIDRLHSLAQYWRA